MAIKTETLGSVAKYINGRAFKPSEWEDCGLPIVRIQNLNDSCANYNYTTSEYDDKFLIKKGDLLFAWSASLGAHIWNGNNAWLNQHIFRVIPNDNILKKYLYYYLCQVVTQLYAKTHGSGMVHITKGPFMSTPIPVPALPEQERIVARIEELFSELDKAVETLNTTKQQLAVYRQAVQKEAFIGALTHSWRNQHFSKTADEVLQDVYSKNNVVGHTDLMENYSLPLLPKSWKWISIGDISKGAEYGSSKKSDKQGKVPVLRMGNIQNGIFQWDDLVYSSDEDEIKKYELHSGDVLFNRTNSPELVGKTAIYKGTSKVIFAGYLIRVNQVDEINGDYLTYYLNSSIARGYGNKVKTDGVNQSNINSKKLYSYPFPLCSSEEQKHIVIELEARLTVCDQIEKTIEQSLQQAEALRQSILKQAFEGRL